VGVMQRSLLTINERVLLFLSSYSYNSKTWDAPEKLTANRIAESVCCSKFNLSYNLKILKELKYLSEIKSYVKGKNKKQNIYFLTKDGESKAKEINKKLMETQIKIINLNGKDLTMPFNDVKEYIDKNNICQGINDLELCKFITIEKTLNIHVVSKMQSNFINLTEDSFNPQYFYGRETELDILKKWIGEQKKFKTILLYGLPGIGKTTLISKLIENYKNSKNVMRLNSARTWCQVVF